MCICWWIFSIVQQWIRTVCLMLYLSCWRVRMLYCRPVCEEFKYSVMWSVLKAPLNSPTPSSECSISCVRFAPSCWQHSDNKLLHRCRPLANNVEYIDRRQAWSYSGMIPEVPFPVGDPGPHLVMVCWAPWSPQAKWHLDRFSRFAALISVCSTNWHTEHR